MLFPISGWYSIELDIDLANSSSDDEPPKKKGKQLEANSAQKGNGTFIIKGVQELKRNTWGQIFW